MRPHWVVQAICVRWSKESRGGRNATLRNQVPEVFELPEGLKPLHMETLFFHCLFFDESNLFISPYISEVLRHDLPKEFDYSCVQVHPTEVGLRVVYQYNMRCGAPERTPIKRDIRLQVGQWGRILYNGRFSDIDDGYWCYEKWTFNIGFFQDPIPHVFLNSPAVKIHSDLALLR